MLVLLWRKKLEPKSTRYHATPHLNASHSARNLGISSDKKNLTLSGRVSALFESCYSHIRQRCIRPYLDLRKVKTASTIATFVLQSKLDCCNSLYFDLPNSPMDRLNLIQNYVVHAVVKAPKSFRISSILYVSPQSSVLTSLPWLKINERFHHKLQATFRYIQDSHNH